MKKGILSIRIDDSLKKGLNKLGSDIKEYRDKGLVKAGFALWDDSVNLEPKPPIMDKTLRDSGNLSVSNKDAGSPDTVEQGGETRTGSVPTGEGVAVFGFNTIYATRMHELPEYKSHTVPEINQGSGPQFIRSKLDRFYHDYIEIAAEEIKKHL